jgi:hypothetical protein
MQRIAHAIKFCVQLCVNHFRQHIVFGTGGKQCRVTANILTDTLVDPALAEVQPRLQLFQDIVKLVKVGEIGANPSYFGALFTKRGAEPLPSKALPEAAKDHVEGEYDAWRPTPAIATVHDHFVSLGERQCRPCRVIDQLLHEMLHAARRHKLVSRQCLGFGTKWARPPVHRDHGKVIGAVTNLVFI